MMLIAGTNSSSPCPASHKCASEGCGCGCGGFSITNSTITLNINLDAGSGTNLTQLQVSPAADCRRQMLTSEIT